jgi:hypothetical protein
VQPPKTDSEPSLDGPGRITRHKPISETLK